jgi:hypothetical protein
MTGHLPEMGGHAGLKYAASKPFLFYCLSFDPITLYFFTTPAA